MSSDGLIPDMPSRDDLNRAVHHALSTSKWAKDAVQSPHLTDEDKARHRLEEFVVKTINTCAEVKHLDEEKTGMPFDEAAMSRLIMSMFMEYTNGECKEALRFLLSMIHTGMILEALKELP